MEGSTVQEQTEGASQLYLNFGLNIAPLALLYYDYILTLADEIEYYWPAGFAMSYISSLFFINRYLLVIGHVPVVLGMILGTRSAGSCGALQTYHQFLQLVLEIPIGILSAARVYAFFSQDRRIMFALGTLMVVLLGLGLGLILTLDINTPIIFFPVAPLCARAISQNDLAHFAAAWSCFLIFETVIVTLTVFRALQLWKAGRIVHAFLRDGVVYFWASFAINLANILNMILSPPLLKTAITTLTNVLSSIFISRLMLALRAENRRPGVEWTDISQSANLDTAFGLSWLSSSRSSGPGENSMRHGEDIELQPTASPLISNRGSH